MKQLVLASGNPGKLRELAVILEDLGYELHAQSEFDVPEVAETGTTFVENAIIKARHAAAHTDLPALADDSGIEVDALGGAPGVESAYYGGGDHDDAANRARLLRELDGVAEADRTARFRTVFVLRRPDGSELVAEGTCEGTIGTVEKGSGGFGYDPMFIPDDGDGRTFGEHSADEKNAISHRSRACRALLVALRAG